MMIIRPSWFWPRHWYLLGAVSLLSANVEAQTQSPLPILRIPDAKIMEVYYGNWSNTLAPCLDVPPAGPQPSPHVEPLRPWKVDVQGHYPGWYPGVDVKHSSAAYLACAKDLPLILRGWDLTTTKYLMDDGGVRPMTMFHSPHTIVPETTVDGSVVFYPLRLTANIDALLLGDMIYRFSGDRAWLAANLPVLRKLAAFLEAWIDDQGLLHSDSYDLDQVYREIDGVAQASAHEAFRRLAALESVAGTSRARRRADAMADRLAAAANQHFWDESLGYYVEHLIYNNIARSNRWSALPTASSELDPHHAAGRAIDGVIGLGIDAFGVGTGVAGRHEWVARKETTGAWFQVNFSRPTRIGRVILLNRTDPQTQSGERFAEGTLEFSDRSAKVPVRFTNLDVSRAVAAFAPREVRWVRFTGTRMQGVGGTNAGLSEFVVLPADTPYRKISHGMTDTSMAMVAFGVADTVRAERVWQHFRQRESSFYEVNGLRAPTWIAEKAETYGPSELNRRAPHKDCVAMGRTWRYDALMRRRMDDGEGLVRTLRDANALYDRPSGGGAGRFAERYGLGRFQPGDEAQATIPAYAEYPAVYNSTVVQRCLLGLDVDVQGTLHIEPCVPSSWYGAGFGQEGCGILKDHDLGFFYRAESVEGWVDGPKGQKSILVRLPPTLAAHPVQVETGGRPVSFRREADKVRFTLRLDGHSRALFTIRSGR
ncbi:MAG: discoidin domain-containing protein [Verrucomicrobiales bacterium]|nr:discoidin domain-containing protein [Verrucomicrobiales bacterium]